MDPTVRLINELTDAATGRTSRLDIVPRVEHRDFVDRLGTASENAHVDQMPVPPGSARALKRLVLKLGRFSLVRQQAVNLSLIGAVAAAMSELDEQRALLSQLQRHAAANAAMATLLAEQTRETSLNAVHQGLRSMRGELEPAIAETAELRRRLDDVGSGREGADDAVLELYERFAATFRPIDEEFRRRLQDYLPDLAQFTNPAFPVLDIGSGHGDLVEHLNRSGITSSGVDSNPAAIAEAELRGIPVVLGDALGHLEGCPPSSLSAVTGLHIIEHLSAAKALRLVKAAYEALRPGGLLILETPNPTNLNVGAASFYHDPTHVRPLTPQYLQFMLTDCGFVGVAVRFLHPPFSEAEPSSEETDDDRLMSELTWALRGPQDFAVLGLRPSDS